jgi:hypothetical protein
MLNGAAATACARKTRRHLISDDVQHLQENQFAIAPSEILKYDVPTSSLLSFYDSNVNLMADYNRHIFKYL